MHVVDGFLARLAPASWLALALALALYVARLACATRAWRNIVATAYPDANVPWRGIFGATTAGMAVSAVVPAKGGDLLRLYLARRQVPDRAARRVHAGRVGHVERRHPLGAERGEGDRVARVVAAEHEHHVERLAEQLVHGVLPVLRRAADRVERAEVRRAVLLAARARHRPPHLLADRERLPREHRRLVGDADAAQVHRRVELRARLRAVLLEERLARQPLALDVLAHVARLRQVAHDQIGAARIPLDLRCRRARLLVVVLAVDERGEAVLRIVLDALPDVEHRAARRVHHHAPDLPQRLEVGDRDAEGGENDDVVRADVRVVEARLAARQKDDPHVAELRVHVRIVDDLAGEGDAPIGELGAGLVGVLHRALDAVAEAELAREPDGDRPRVERERARAQQVHEPPGVVGGERVLDLGLEAEALAVVGAAVGRRHGGS